MFRRVGRGLVSTRPVALNEGSGLAQMRTTQRFGAAQRPDFRHDGVVRTQMLWPMKADFEHKWLKLAQTWRNKVRLRPDLGRVRTGLRLAFSILSREGGYQAGRQGDLGSDLGGPPRAMIGVPEPQCQTADICRIFVAMLPRSGIVDMQMPDLEKSLANMHSFTSRSRYLVSDMYFSYDRVGSSRVASERRQDGAALEEHSWQPLLTTRSSFCLAYPLEQAAQARMRVRGGQRRPKLIDGGWPMP